MIRSFRIVQTSRLKTAFAGEGSRLAGGRWNFKGTPLVYSADSLSLATLEVMANMDDYALMEKSYSYIPIEIPEPCIEFYPVDALPKGWDSHGPNETSMLIGEAWVIKRRSAVLRVPSVITKMEWNYLINPLHPDFKKLKIGRAERLRFDSRLKK